MTPSLPFTFASFLHRPHAALELLGLRLAAHRNLRLPLRGHIRPVAAERAALHLVGRQAENLNRSVQCRRCEGEPDPQTTQDEEEWPRKTQQAQEIPERRALASLLLRLLRLVWQLLFSAFFAISAVRNSSSRLRVYISSSGQIVRRDSNAPKAPTAPPGPRQLRTRPKTIS